MASADLAAVYVSLPTVDDDLSSVLEPRISRPPCRLRAIDLLSARGIPVVTLVAPVNPGLTNHEIPPIIEQVAAAGATHAGFIVLRFPLTVAPLFEAWLMEHRPLAASKVVQRIRQICGSCRRSGLNAARPASRIDLFRRPATPVAVVDGQLSLFD